MSLEKTEHLTDLISKIFPDLSAIQQEQLIQYSKSHLEFENGLYVNKSYTTLPISLQILNRLFVQIPNLEISTTEFNKLSQIKITLKATSKEYIDSIHEDPDLILIDEITKELSLLLATSDYSKLGLGNKALIQSMEIDSDINHFPIYSCIVNVSIN